MKVVNIGFLIIFALCIGCNSSLPDPVLDNKKDTSKNSRFEIVNTGQEISLRCLYNITQLYIKELEAKGNTVTILKPYHKSLTFEGKFIYSPPDIVFSQWGSGSITELVFNIQIKSAESTANYKCIATVTPQVQRLLNDDNKHLFLIAMNVLVSGPYTITYRNAVKVELDNGNIKQVD